MPTYVYRCDSCDHQFEMFQKMSDAPMDTCPECGSRVRRVIHPVGIVFRGSGWYINDSKSSGSSKDTAAVNGDASEPTKVAKKSADADAKVATKVEKGAATSGSEAPAKAAAD
jgi:putative FmdB family regulatory protein